MDYQTLVDYIFIGIISILIIAILSILIPIDISNQNTIPLTPTPTISPTIDNDIMSSDSYNFNNSFKFSNITTNVTSYVWYNTTIKVNTYE